MTIDFNGLKWNRYLTENVPDGDNVDIVQDGYIKNSEFYNNDPIGGIKVVKYIQNIDGNSEVRYAEYSKLFPDGDDPTPYEDAPTPPSSPLSNSLKVDLELEILGSRNTNDLTQFWDSSGNDRHGTAINGFNVNSGLKGNALYGEKATDQKLYLGGLDASLKTFSCWVYNDLVKSGNSVNGQMRLIFDYNNAVTTLFISEYSIERMDPVSVYIVNNIGSEDNIGSFTTSPLGWHHVVFVQTGTRPFWSIWIDGIESTDDWYESFSAWDIYYSTPNIIGFGTNTYMDLLRGWSRTLSAAEISELYNSGLGI